MNTSTHLLVASLLACATLGACNDSTTTSDIPATTSRGDSTREPLRSDSGVTVLPLGSTYIASQQITFELDDGQASTGVVQLRSQTGDVRAMPSEDGYVITVALQAEGRTEMEARAALVYMQVQHLDRLGGDTLKLSTQVDFTSHNGGSSDGLFDSQLRQADIYARLPLTLFYQLRTQSHVGGASADGLEGSTLRVQTDVGSSAGSGQWDEALLTSDVGDVLFVGDATVLQAATDVGNVALALTADHSSRIDTSVGVGSTDISLAIYALDAGFDLRAQTDVGSATILMRNTEPQGTQTATEAHYRSANYDHAAERFAVKARAGTGSVTIHD